MRKCWHPYRQVKIFLELFTKHVIFSCLLFSFVSWIGPFAPAFGIHPTAHHVSHANRRHPRLFGYRPKR